MNTRARFGQKSKEPKEYITAHLSSLGAQI